MKCINLIIILLIAFILQSCGGGGGSGNNDGALLLTVSATSVGAGKSLTASATLSSASGRPVNNLTPTYVSSVQEVIPNVTDTKGTSSVGLSQVPLTTRNVRDTPVDVTIYAVVDGIKSNEVHVTVNPATLSLAAPADATFSQTSTGNVCTGGIVRDVSSGASALFKDSTGQVISGQQVTMSVTSITNYTTGDLITFYPSGATTVIIPPWPNSVTLTTDSNGTAFLPVTIDGILPTIKGSSHVFVVNWLATTQIMGDAGIPIQYTVAKQTMVTNSCQ
ncbi:MAG TPA: hypothetical protein V6D19_25140 [Stenomitos sp.]